MFFGVPLPDASVSVIPIWDTLGLRATRSQLLAFNQTLLRAAYRGRAPRPGDFAVVPSGLPAISLGIADAALAALTAHAATRVILGQPLSHQQWVQHAVADARPGWPPRTPCSGVRIGGANGYLRASPIQRHLRDAEAGQLMAYSTEVLATEIGPRSARRERRGLSPQRRGPALSRRGPLA